jgi:hypothetical protein
MHACLLHKKVSSQFHLLRSGMVGAGLSPAPTIPGAWLTTVLNRRVMPERTTVTRETSAL